MRRIFLQIMFPILLTLEFYHKPVRVHRLCTVIVSHPWVPIREARI